MVRLVITSLLAFAAVCITSSEDAEACGLASCQTMLASLDLVQDPEVQGPKAEAPRVAPAADESEVRAKDLAKKEPPAPAFWLQFKSYAYQQLPTHQEKNFTAVWIAMAVETPDETVAGVGLQGVWW